MPLLHKKPMKILLRSPNWVGDAIMATPVPNALKRTAPDCQVHVLARAWTAPLWEQHPDVDRIIVLGGGHAGGFWPWFKTVRWLRQEHYDLCLVLPNSFSSAWMAFWTGSAKRLGYNTQQRGWLLNLKAPWHQGLFQWPRPKIYLNLARLAGADVDYCQKWNFTLKVTPEELVRAEALLGAEGKGRFLGLAPGSVASSRRWPSERYAELADLLTAEGYQVVLLGSPSDRPVVENVVRRAKSRLLALAGRTDLRLAMAVMRRLELLISNDSGAMHMAYAQGVPVLVLQGAADQKVTGPFGAGSHILRDASLACAPCVRNECPRKNLLCMRNISVAQVWEKCRQILKGDKIKSEKKNG
ncbi:lipopolysaccharide heptosyltransferase II [candidate division FCPU426 bacterium]|nr:lipopolysaccharide heptosyltransferase II [candidate division FCPU426 bacterium]